MNSSILRRGYIVNSSVFLAILLGILIGMATIIPELLYLILGGLTFVFFSFYIYSNPKKGLVILFFGFLLNPMIVSKVIPTIFHLSPSMSDILGMWKEWILLLLTCRVLSSRKTTKRNPIIIFVIVLMAYGLIYIFVNKSFTQGVMGYRYYFEAMILFFILGKMQVDNDFLKRFLKIFSGFIFLMGMWSLLVSLFLGYNFMFSVGYTNYGGVPHFSYLVSGHTGLLRTFGTLSAPNNYGVFLVISILLLIIFKDMFKRKVFLNINLVLQLVLLTLTYSRSAWIGLLLSLVVYFIISNPKTKIKFIVAFFLGISGFVIYCLREPNNPAIAFFMSTVTLRDTSAAGHLNSWAEDIQFILNHPFGIGLGKAGPKAFAITGVYLNPEMSFYTVAYEMGILGMLLFLVFNVFAIFYLFKKFKITVKVNFLHSRLYLLAGLSWLVLVVSYLFLPMIQEMEVTLIPYFITALAMNYKYKVD